MGISVGALWRILLWRKTGNAALYGHKSRRSVFFKAWLLPARYAGGRAFSWNEEVKLLASHQTGFFIQWSEICLEEELERVCLSESCRKAIIKQILHLQYCIMVELNTASCKVWDLELQCLTWDWDCPLQFIHMVLSHSLHDIGIFKMNKSLLWDGSSWWQLPLLLPFKRQLQKLLLVQFNIVKQLLVSFEYFV